MVDRRRDDGHGNLQCSFCGKSQKEVKKLIAGPTVYICDECIGLCNDIIAEEIEKEEQKGYDPDDFQFSNQDPGVAAAAMRLPC